MYAALPPFTDGQTEARSTSVAQGHRANSKLELEFKPSCSEAELLVDCSAGGQDSFFPSLIVIFFLFICVGAVGKDRYKSRSPWTQF